MPRLRSNWMKWASSAVMAAAVTGCSSRMGATSCDDDCSGPLDAPRLDIGGATYHRSQSIPDQYPLGSVMRAHFHTMQTNAEAADFILHRNEFVNETAELTPYGKDHILEIAARMRSAPFPVLVERSENNCDPELDEHRRTIVAKILFDMGSPDADQRVFVAPAYGKGLNAVEGQADYYRYLGSRGNGFGGGFGNGGYNGFGGFGGGAGFGAGGFGGGGFGNGFGF